MECDESSVIKKTNTSVLKNTCRLNKRNKRHESLSPSKKKVMFDSSSLNKPSRFSKNNLEASPRPRALNQKRHNSSCNSSTKRISINNENSFVEIIEPNGSIKKEKIKGDTINREFSMNRNKNNSGEFIKAQEYYNKTKETDELDDFVEDTLTNTMRNQFVGKLEIIDGMAHAPLKNIDNENNNE